MVRRCGACSFMRSAQELAINRKVGFSQRRQILLCWFDNLTSGRYINVASPVPADHSTGPRRQPTARVASWSATSTAQKLSPWCCQRDSLNSCSPIQPRRLEIVTVRCARHRRLEAPMAPTTHRRSSRCAMSVQTWQSRLYSPSTTRSPSIRWLRSRRRRSAPRPQLSQWRLNNSNKWSTSTSSTPTRGISGVWIRTGVVVDWSSMRPRWQPKFPAQVDMTQHSTPSTSMTTVALCVPRSDSAHWSIYSYRVYYYFVVEHRAYTEYISLQGPFHWIGIFNLIT